SANRWKPHARSQIAGRYVVDDLLVHLHEKRAAIALEQLNVEPRCDSSAPSRLFVGVGHSMPTKLAKPNLLCIIFCITLRNAEQLKKSSHSETKPSSVICCDNSKSKFQL